MTSSAVLFDGWALARAPLSPSALHLLDLLPHLPESISPHVALPQEPPQWLPDGLQTHVLPTGSTPANRQRWEQKTLPATASNLDAALHLTASYAPLFTGRRVIVSPAADPATSRSFRGRLRRAIGRGGTARARVLWPADVPPPVEHPDALQLSPAVHPAFKPQNRFRPPEIPDYPALPETFFLVHLPPDQDAVRQALEAWTWASGPIGEVYPLLFVGLPPGLQQQAERLMRTLQLRDTVLFFPAPPPPALHLVYQSASAVFHPAQVEPWSSPLRYGIACGRPVVGLETAVSSAIAGPAAYFAEENDPRSLGAALISVIVRDDTRKQLVDAALLRARSWSHEELQRGLEGVYAD